MYVQIAWTAPISNYVSIDAYKILIQTNTSTYVEDITDCDGGSSTVMNNMYCLVPMTTLRASPYNLVYGGWSSVSSPNTAGPTI
jgi:hypothetical protein